MSESVLVAEGLKDFLAAGEFSQKIEPERSYLDYALEMVDDEFLHVDIVATISKQKVELSTNDSFVYTIPVDIVVRKVLGEGEQEDGTGRARTEKVDELQALTEELFEYCIPERLPEYDSAVWKSTEILVSPLTKHLRENKQFTSVVRVTYEVEKDFA